MGEFVNIPREEALEFDQTNEGDRIVVTEENLREKPSTGSPSGESEFISEGAIGKTVGLSYARPEGV